MIPSSFDYAAPTSVADVVAALGNGSEAKLLAGGQSFIPVLRLRMADPDLVVGLAKVAELSEVSMDGDTLVVGAMVTHDAASKNGLIEEHAPLLAKAAASVADPQVRHRGTIGGSAAHADPAGDIGPALLAMDATMVIVGPSGERQVPASEFFVDVFTTDLEEDEVLTQVRIPSFAGWSAHYEKFNRVSQQWSIVAVGALVRKDGGSIAEARMCLTNMGATPLRAHGVESALAGAPANAEAIAAACAGAGEGTDPQSDLNGDATYRKHLAGVLAKRAVLAAAGVE